MTRYSASMSEALKKIRNTVSERDLTDTEEKRREEIAKDLPDQEFKDKYGARWKEVKMATATNMVKKENLNEALRWKVKIEGLPPVYMDAGSAGEVKTKLRKLLKQPDMLQDIERVTDVQMKKDLKDRISGKDEENIKEAREKPARQLLNPNKEEMVVKKNEVIVIDKKDLDKYLKRGWALAEEVELDEAKYQVNYAKNNKLYSQTINAKNEDDAEEKAIKKFKITDDDIRSVVKETLDEEVADLFVQDKVGSNHQVQIALKIKGLAKKLGLRTGIMGNQVRVMGPKKIVTQFMGSILGKSSLGNPTENGASSPQIDKMLKKQLREEAELDEGKYLKYSDLLLQKSRLVDKHGPESKEVQAVNKELAKEKKKLGIKEEVELDEQFDYVLLDKDNKIIARYKGRDAKKQAELNKKGAEKKLGVKKPIKVYPIRPTDKKKIGDTVLAIGEAKLIDKPTGEVLKTGSKKEMETERKRNRDELQVKEWFKSKGIDVTIRKLDDATQAYVKLGKIIPNEIREDLVKIQYGELPEDIKNTNNIVYGNFKENSITMNNEFWKKVFEARKDDPSQEQDTNIIMQLRKSVSLKGMKDVEFNDGKKVKVKPQIANAVMDKFDTYRTTDQKLKFQQKIAKSYKDLLSALKEK